MAKEQILIRVYKDHELIEHFHLPKEVGDNRMRVLHKIKEGVDSSMKEEVERTLAQGT